MTPSHHPDPEELLGYAAGTSPEWSSLLVACHLTYCPACREDVALYQEVGGALLDGLEPTGTTPDLSAALSRRPSPPQPRDVRPMPDPRLPRPLSAYFAAERPRWRFLTPSISHIPLRLSVNGLPLRVFRFREGYVIPDHVHRDTESILVFSGTLGDSRTGARFGPGDLCRNASGSEHFQDVGKDEPCVCLVINEGLLVPKSLWGRFLKKIAGV